jgi:hypothetical protein
VEPLFEQSRRIPNIKNRIDAKIEAAVIEYALAFPAHGQRRTNNELRLRGVFISGSRVRCVWLHQGLTNLKARLRALEAKVAHDGIILTEA